MESKTIENYLPGNTWLYYKIYSGIKIADEILIDDINSMCNELIHNKLIKKFFFIRYRDPKPHLRLRLLLAHTQCVNEIMFSVNERFNPFIESNLIGGLQVDTYQRELERYNIDSIQNSEEIFCLESKLLLEYLQFEKQYDDRLYFVISLVDFYLSNVGLNIKEKKKFTETMKYIFSKEFTVDNNFKRTIERKYREKRFQIDKYLFNKEDTEILNLIQLYSEELKKHLNAIINTPSVNLQYLDSIIQSHIHMLVNRTFRGNQRLFELIVYDFLTRAYNSKIARLKSDIARVCD